MFVPTLFFCWIVVCFVALEYLGILWFRLGIACLRFEGGEELEEEFLCSPPLVLGVFFFFFIVC